MTDTDRIDPDGLLRETRWLHALAGGLVHDEHAAEDVVQSTFLQALTHPPRDAGALRTWLAQVARRFAYRSSDRARWIRRWERDAARPEAQPSAADLVGRASVHRRLVEEVLALEEPNRSTILLRYFEDLPPREIAKRQGVPVATVRSRVRRALEQLRERLDRSAGGREAWLSLLGIPAAPVTAAAAGATAVAGKTKLVIAATVVLLIAGGFAWKTMQPSDGAKEEPGRASPRVASNEVAADAAPARPDAAPSPTSRPIRPRRFDEVAGEPREHEMFGVVIDDDTGDPLSGAEVTVVRDEKGAEPARMVTKTDGRFALPMPGSYWDPRVDRMRIVAPGHVPFVSDDPWSGDRSTSRPRARDVDFGEIRIERGAVVSGRIVTAEGRPVAGATLFLKRGVSVFDPCSGMSPAGISAEDGSFTLPDRVASNVRNGSIRETFLIALHTGGVDWEYLSVVKGADRVPVEIVARAGFAARVAVVDAERRPLPDAVVLALPKFAPLGHGGGAYRPPPKPEVPSADSAACGLAHRLVQKTDAEGIASFTRLPEGRVDATFDRGSENAIEFFAYRDGFEPGSARLASPFTPNTVTIILAPIRERAVVGTVKDAKGSPVAGASIGFQGAPAAKTNGSGEYRVPLGKAAQAGEWVEVTATAEGLAFGGRRVQVALGQPDPQVDFVLEPAAPVSGRVVDEAGKPVAGVRVVVRRDHGPYVPGENNGVTRDDGRFSFPLADAGQFELIAHAAFANDSDWEFEPSRGRAVFGGQAVEVVLRRRAAGKASVVAEVVDESNGEALDPAAAVILPAHVSNGDYYDQRGTMLLASRGRATGEKIAPGSWRLFVAAVGYARYEQAFTVGPDDQEVRLKAALARPAVVIAKVVLDDVPADRRPAQVTIGTPDCRWVTEPGKPASKTTRGSAIASEANQWTCRFEDVTPGAPLRFWLESEDGATDEQLLKVRSGETKTIELRPKPAGKARLSTTGKVSGEVRLQAGDETGGWYGIAVKAVDPAAVWTHEITRPAGTFRWRVQILPLDVPARLRQPKFVEGEAKVEAGKTTEIEVRVPE